MCIVCFSINFGVNGFSGVGSRLNRTYTSGCVVTVFCDLCA